MFSREQPFGIGDARQASLVIVLYHDMFLLTWRVKYLMASKRDIKSSSFHIPLFIHAHKKKSSSAGVTVNKKYNTQSN